MTENTKIVRDLVERMRQVTEGLSIRKIGGKVGRPYRTVHNYLNQGREPPVSFILDFCRAFNVGEQWLLTGRGAKSGEEARVLEDVTEYIKTGPDETEEFSLPVQIQPLSELTILTPEEYRKRLGDVEGPEAYSAIPLVVDPVAAGESVVIEDKNIESFVIIHSRWVPPGRVTAVRVKGDSMLPTLPEGSLRCRPPRRPKIQSGDLYFLYDLVPRSRVLLDTRLIHDSWRKGCRDERTKARGGFGGGRP